MRCHFTYVVERGKPKKYLIPHCMDVMHSDNIRDCTCPPDYTVHFFEKERFREVVKEKDDMIKSMRSEIDHLISVIEELKKVTNKKNKI